MFLVIGFVYALATEYIDFSFQGYKSFIYLTNWCLILHALTFLYFMFNPTNTSTAKKILVTSFSLGWAVTIMFWIYIYPIVDLSLLPPAYQYISSHGGVNTLISLLFVKSDIEVNFSDIKWPIFVILLYMLGMVIPMKYAGYIIYPFFMDQLIPTLLIIFGSLFFLSIGFYFGYYLKSKKFKKY